MSFSDLIWTAIFRFIKWYFIVWFAIWVISKIAG
jgi:hypothetical protein